MLNTISHGGDYEHSAHVLAVLTRFKLDSVASGNFLEDFILIHDCFAHPARVFEDDVSLYKMTPSHIIFVQCPGKPAAWDVKAFPFSRVGQHKRAERVIVVPKWSIVRLLEETGYANSYKERLIFLGMTARCGSTLLCQIFHETQSCIAYSEPGLPNDLHIFANTMASRNCESENTKKYIKYAFMLLCKPVQDRDTVAHIMKFQPGCSPYIRYLQVLFPDSRALFIYRDVRSAFRSYLKIVPTLPIVVVLAALALVSNKVYDKFLVSNGHRPPGKRDYFASIEKLLTQRESDMFYDFVPPVAEYFKAREQGCPMAGIRYEDLVAEPEAILGKAFRHCGIPLELVARGLPAMGRDSQKGSPLDWQAVAKHKNSRLSFELSDKLQRDLKTLCQEFSVPDLLVNEILPGTLRSVLMTGYDLRTSSGIYRLACIPTCKSDQTCQSSLVDLHEGSPPKTL